MAIHLPARVPSSFFYCLFQTESLISTGANSAARLGTTTRSLVDWNITSDPQHIDIQGFQSHSYPAVCLSVKLSTHDCPLTSYCDSVHTDIHPLICWFHLHFYFSSEFFLSLASGKCTSLPSELLVMNHGTELPLSITLSLSLYSWLLCQLPTTWQHKHWSLWGSSTLSGIHRPQKPNCFSKLLGHYSSATILPMVK